MAPGYGTYARELSVRQRNSRPQTNLALAQAQQMYLTSHMQGGASKERSPWAGTRIMRD